MKGFSEGLFAVGKRRNLFMEREKGLLGAGFSSGPFDHFWVWF